MIIFPQCVYVLWLSLSLFLSLEEHVELLGNPIKAGGNDFRLPAGARAQVARGWKISGTRPHWHIRNGSHAGQQTPNQSSYVLYVDYRMQISFVDEASQTSALFCPCFPYPYIYFSRMSSRRALVSV